MRLTVILETTDDAAIEDPAGEAARSLQIIKNRIEINALVTGADNALQDTNGNTIGYFSFDPEHGEQADD